MEALNINRYQTSFKIPLLTEKLNNSDVIRFLLVRDATVVMLRHREIKIN